MALDDARAEQGDDHMTALWLFVGLLVFAVVALVAVLLADAADAIKHGEDEDR